jgi:hypothetical protein
VRRRSRELIEFVDSRNTQIPTTYPLDKGLKNMYSASTIHSL